MAFVITRVSTTGETKRDPVKSKYKEALLVLYSVELGTPTTTIQGGALGTLLQLVAQSFPEHLCIVHITDLCILSWIL